LLVSEDYEGVVWDLPQTPIAATGGLIAMI
jgi:hypothetical protein